MGLSFEALNVNVYPMKLYFLRTLAYGSLIEQGIFLRKKNAQKRAEFLFADILEDERKRRKLAWEDFFAQTGSALFERNQLWVWREGAWCLLTGLATDQEFIFAKIEERETKDSLFAF